MGSRLEYLPGKWKAEVNSDENLVRTIHSRRSTVFSKGQEVCADYFVQRIFMEKTEQIKTKNK